MLQFLTANVTRFQLVRDRLPIDLRGVFARGLVFEPRDNVLLAPFPPSRLELAPLCMEVLLDLLAVLTILLLERLVSFDQRCECIRDGLQFGLLLLQRARQIISTLDLLQQLVLSLDHCVAFLHFLCDLVLQINSALFGRLVLCAQCLLLLIIRCLHRAVGRDLFIDAIVIAECLQNVRARSNHVDPPRLLLHQPVTRNVR
mmetsp:Transcript_42669/g.68493  ORF Transcript_42669/g.68493 Transcript_42669/m.68493 type:complete len:201 (-) Transcript_42669:105-707(-)